MLRTLRSRLAAFMVGLFVLLGALNALWMIRTSRSYLQEVDQRLDRDLAKHLADANIVSARGLLDRKAAPEVFNTLMVINRNIEIYLLDLEGRILAFSAPPGAVARATVRMEPIRRFLAGDQLPILGDDPRHLSREKVFSVAEFRSAPPSPDGSNPPEGYLYVILVGEEYASPLQFFSSSRILRSSALGLAGSLAVILAASLLIVRALTRRLSTLGQQMETFGTSGFSQMPTSEAPADAPDEIGRLRRTFPGMASQIARQFDQLKENDRMRRELVANVSHDLRTPLQALQGYLETLLAKEGALDSAERRRYLESAVKHSAGLGSLISHLFELAKLEAKEVRPTLEPFSLCELVHDVAQRFELPARSRGLTIRTDLAQGVALAVGDVALIDRVLVNLVENALQHTPSGGAVDLTCFAAGGRVVTRVRDTGPGIRPQDLSRVLERHYRAEENHRTREGAGLGLAIAQRILELHGSALEVQSGENDGAVFTFTLPQSDGPPSPTQEAAHA